MGERVIRKHSPLNQLLALAFPPSTMCRLAATPVNDREALEERIRYHFFMTDKPYQVLATTYLLGETPGADFFSKWRKSQTLRGLLHVKLTYWAIIDPFPIYRRDFSIFHIHSLVLTSYCSEILSFCRVTMSAYNSDVARSFL